MTGFHIEFADSVLDEAHNNMRGARRRLGRDGAEYRSPCMLNPNLFDPQSDREHWIQFERRAALAVGLCETACRIFVECQALKAADPEILGVVAGEVVESALTIQQRNSRKKRKAKGAAKTE